MTAGPVGPALKAHLPEPPEPAASAEPAEILNQHFPLQNYQQHQNHLLADLPCKTIASLATHLELVTLRPGDMLYQPGSQLSHAYFPTTAIVSMHCVMDSGASAEAAGVGNEGMLGVPLFMGGQTMNSFAVVQTGGYAWRLQAHLLKQVFDRGDALQHALLRYAQALITQMMQTAACNRHHVLEQQLCRWLLQTLDRSASYELTLTQEQVANMLGVRRESVTEAAQKLQKAGLISYRRGHITVLDRVGLERHACECYGVVKREIFRLLCS